MDPEYCNISSSGTTSTPSSKTKSPLKKKKKRPSTLFNALGASTASHILKRHQESKDSQHHDHLNYYSRRVVVQEVRRYIMRVRKTIQKGGPKLRRQFFVGLIWIFVAWITMRTLFQWIFGSPIADPLVLLDISIEGPHKLNFLLGDDHDKSLIRLDPWMGPLKENTIPLPTAQRIRHEAQSDADGKLRLLGNRALIQYGNVVRDLLFSVDAEHYLLNATKMVPAEYNHQKKKDDEQAQSFRQRLQQLAPWLKGDYKQPNWPLDQFPRMGEIQSKPTAANDMDCALLVCAGDKQFLYLEALLHTIRKVHGSKIAIYVSYKGDNDLSQASRDKLQSTYSSHSNAHAESRLSFLDLTQSFELDAAKVNGWNLKIFGLLLIPETKVAFLDVDVLLLQTPEKLFKQESFQKHGALFFHDRSALDTLGLWSPKELLYRVQPHPSPTAQRALVMKTTNDKDEEEYFYSEHVMESGVVVLNKRRRFRGLWAACLLMGRWDLRRFAQRDLVYGDKELYWIAFEMANDPYVFARFYPGVIGGVMTDFKDSGIHVAAAGDAMKEYSHMALCGRLVHFNDEGLPLWSNGGYLTKEDDRDKETSASKNGLEPKLFIDGGDSITEKDQPVQKPGLNQYWKFHDDMGVNCLDANARKVRPVPSEQVQKGTEAVNYYLEIISGKEPASPLLRTKEKVKFKQP